MVVVVAGGVWHLRGPGVSLLHLRVVLGREEFLLFVGSEVVGHLWTGGCDGCGPDWPWICRCLLVSLCVAGHLSPLPLLPTQGPPWMAFQILPLVLPDWAVPAASPASAVAVLVRTSYSGASLLMAW